jgi:hypothetical protein
LPDIHTLDIVILSPYALIVDALQGHLSELPDIHNADMGIFGPCGQISDDEQGYFS